MKKFPLIVVYLLLFGLSVLSTSLYYYFLLIDEPQSSEKLLFGFKRVIDVNLAFFLPILIVIYRTHRHYLNSSLPSAKPLLLGILYVVVSTAAFYVYYSFNPSELWELAVLTIFGKMLIEVIITAFIANYTGHWVVSYRKKPSF